MQNVSAIYDLIEKLNIRHIFVSHNQFKIVYQKDNQAIIAYGNSEEELLENFYQLYQELQQIW